MSMPVVRINRVAPFLGCTFGVLSVCGQPLCVTLERPWVNNEKNISCIPTGEYFCKKTVSLRYGETYEVMNVPDRSGILFHIGNLVDNTRGCILVARRFGRLYGKPAILNSTEGFCDFIKALNECEIFKLYISQFIL